MDVFREYRKGQLHEFSGSIEEISGMKWVKYDSALRFRCCFLNSHNPLCD